MNLKNYAKSESEMLLERFGITGQLAKDFIAHRKTKRGAISETQLSRLQNKRTKQEFRFVKWWKFASNATGRDLTHLGIGVMRNCDQIHRT